MVYNVHFTCTIYNGVCSNVLVSPKPCQHAFSYFFKSLYDKRIYGCKKPLFILRTENKMYKSNKIVLYADTTMCGKIICSCFQKLQT